MIIEFIYTKFECLVIKCIIICNPTPRGRDRNGILRCIPKLHLNNKSRESQKGKVPLQQRYSGEPGALPPPKKN